MNKDTKRIIANCPACGYGLDFLPWDNGSPADEICSCCGIQFGYEDIYADTEDDFRKVYEKWREHWIKDGYKWFSPNPPPANWNAKKQLRKYLSKSNPDLNFRKFKDK